MLRRPIRSSLLPSAAIASLALLAACGPKGVKTYVAPSDSTIEALTEMSAGGEAQVIVVTNHSTVPIVVTGVSLVSCENIKNRCNEATRMKVKLAPGQRRTVLTVRPENPQRAHGFRFTWTWSAEGTDPLAGVTP